MYSQPRPIDAAEYERLAQLCLEPLPVFLRHVTVHFPQHSQAEWCDFYLKNRARKLGCMLFLQCELTPLCNLDCKMCYVHLDPKQAGDRILTTEQWLSIFEQAVAHGVYTVCLSGGEAMLHPGFWEIYDYLHSKGVLVTLFTNGLLLTQQTVDRLAKKQPKGIQISMYGCSNDGYLHVTGVPAFHCVESALERLNRAGIPFRVAVTPSSYLYPEIDALLHYLHEKKYPYRVNTALFPARKETGREIESAELTPLQWGTIWELFSQLEEKSCVFAPAHPLLSAGRPVSPTDGISCDSGVTSAHIDYMGRMNGCSALPLTNADVLALGLEQAWQLVRKQSGLRRLPPKCLECAVRSRCHFCPGEHYASEEPAYCNEKVCSRTEVYLEHGILPFTKCDC